MAKTYRWRNEQEDGRPGIRKKSGMGWRMESKQLPELGNCHNLGSRPVPLPARALSPPGFSASTEAPGQAWPSSEAGRSRPDPETTPSAHSARVPRAPWRAQTAARAPSASPPQAEVRTLAPSLRGSSRLPTIPPPLSQARVPSRGPCPALRSRAGSPTRPVDRREAGGLGSEGGPRGPPQVQPTLLGSPLPSLFAQPTILQPPARHVPRRPP